jgi:hypothetical protein
VARYGERLRLYIVYSIRDERVPGASLEREDYFGALRGSGAAKGELTAAVRRIMARQRR